MQVTSETKYIDFYPYEAFLSNESIDQIKDAAVREFGQYTDLTIEKFNNMTNLTTEQAGKDYPTVFGVYWLLGFKDFIEEFSNTIKNLTIQPTATEMNASSVCYPTTMIESMLVFSQSWFGLKSYAEAAQVTLGDYLIARKADYNSKMFERRMSELQTQKIKNKK